MKRYNLNFITVGLAAGLFLLAACGGTSNTAEFKLPPQEFMHKMKESATMPVLDVRSAEEFAGGHLPNARNLDWNGDSFEQEVSKLDKQQPVMVYCLSGGRSSAAASRMREQGFTQVYELKGGINQWRDAGLQETR